MLHCFRKYVRCILCTWSAVILYFCILTLNRRLPALRQSSTHVSPEVTTDIYTNTGRYTFHPDDVTTSTMKRQSRCIVPAFAQRVHMYLNALQHAVAIVPLPANLTTMYRDKCAALTAQQIRKKIETHPHSLELHFPSILQDMSSSSSFSTVNGSSNRLLGSDFDPLWHPSALSSSPSSGAMAEPLFYYVAALPYHVVYCTSKRRHKEDWTGRDKYWMQVADYLFTEKDTTKAAAADKTRVFHPDHRPANGIFAKTDTPASVTSATSAFWRNMGADFVVPSSHPQLSPGKMHPSSLSYLLRTSFLRTDLDVSGSTPKDVVVPYFLPVDDSSVITDQEDSRLYQQDKDEAAAADAATLQSCRTRHSGSVGVSNTTSTTVSRRRHRLLFFAGSDNPRNGFRTLFYRQLQRAMTLERKSVKPAETTTMSTEMRGMRGEGDGLAKTIDSGGVYFHLNPLPLPQSAVASFFSLFSRAATTTASVHDITEGEEVGLSSQQQQHPEGRWFARQMRESLFCLVLRGDTTSSLRLFHAVANGCVPVVISDGLASHLPFGEGMLDYSKFALFFPESIATTSQGMRHLLHTLRSLSTTTTMEMQCALLEARRYLLYHTHHTSSSSLSSFKSLLNPVTLTLMDLLMRRETYCRSVIAQNDNGTMCRNLLARLKIASDLKATS